MQEILNNILPWNYCNELRPKQWNIYKEPFQLTVNRLEAAELSLKAAAVVTVKSIANLKQESNSSGSTCKHNHNDQEKAAGEKKLGSYWGKEHAGICLKKNGRRGGANGEQDLNFSKKQNTYIKSLIANQVKKSRKLNTDSGS